MRQWMDNHLETNSMQRVLGPNTAIALALLSWVFLFFALTSLLGDPKPGLEAEGVALKLRDFWALSGIGLGLIFWSGWLAARAFSTAKWRAMVSILFCIMGAAFVAYTLF